MADFFIFVSSLTHVMLIKTEEIAWEVKSKILTFSSKMKKIVKLALTAFRYWTISSTFLAQIWHSFFPLESRDSDLSRYAHEFEIWALFGFQNEWQRWLMTIFQKLFCPLWPSSRCGRAFRPTCHTCLESLEYCLSNKKKVCLYLTTQVPTRMLFIRPSPLKMHFYLVNSRSGSWWICSIFS